MNFFLAIFLLSLVTYSQQMLSADTPMYKRVDEYKDICIHESGASPILVEKLKDGEIDDRKVKCYVKCIYQKLGRMNEYGQLQFDKEKPSAPPGVDVNKFEEILKKCGAIKESDSCETAYKAALCFRTGYKALN